MDIYLMRHLKVDFNWNNSYNSLTFNQACKLYDTAAIIENDIHLDFSPQKTYISNLSRTAATLNNINLSSPIIKTELLNEVPLSSFTNINIKLPTFIWMLFGRLQWYFNHSKQLEGKRKTDKRIEEFINLILKENDKDGLIIGHGFYFYSMKSILKKHGFTGSNTNYCKNGQMVKFSKNCE